MNHDDTTAQPDVEIIPLGGLGTLRLGDAEADVRLALTGYGLMVEDQEDPYCWEYPWCTLSFANKPVKCLVQIYSESEQANVFGRRIIGLRLDEALLTLGVQRFDDTVWSMISPDTDFAGGKPFVDQVERTDFSRSELLCWGTLWIKSMGLGLELVEAKVNAVSIRQAQYVPQIGLGPIDEQTLLDASDSEVLAKLSQAIENAPARTRSAVWRRGLLWLVTIVTGAVLCGVIATMVGDYFSWTKATPVNGKVVEMTPPGPFPDYLVVEYPMPNGQSSRATVPMQYTTARELGQAVELVCLPTDPGRAMTKLQSRDYFSSLSLNWLILLIPLFGLEICFLFPKFNRRGR